MNPGRAHFVLAFFAGSLFLSEAHAIPTGSAFNFVPSRFETVDLTAGSRSLGELCYSRDVMPDGSVCNPAHLAAPREHLLLGRVFFGNGYAALSTANSLVFEKLTSEFLQRLFQEQNVTSVEAHIGILFNTQYFTAGFSPYRVQYVSEVRNPNLPVISVHAALERRLFLATGFGLGFLDPSLSSVSVGTRLNIIDRQYVHGSFSLFQAISDNPDTFLPLNKQSAVRVDTVLSWSPPRALWSPQVSLGVVNVGWVSRFDPLYVEPVDLVAGIAIRPPVARGKFRLGVDLVNLTQGESFASRFRTGASYQFGIIELMTGFNDRAWTAGAQMGFQFLSAAVVYEFIRSDYTDTGYLPPENRISTEIGLRL